MLNSIPAFWLIAPFSAVLALVIAKVFFSKLIAKSEGTDKMIEIAGYVKEGAQAYLTRQNKVVAIVFAVIFILLGVLAVFGVQNPFGPFVFLTGGIWSAVCGYLGMKTATNASARTASECQSSLNKGLNVSFRGGAIMGLVVVGFGLAGISIWFFILNLVYDANLFNLSSGIATKLGYSGLNDLVLSS